MILPDVNVLVYACPGTARAMIDGTVIERWARHQHPRWHEEQTRG